jgi:hypothetical protein
MLHPWEGSSCEEVKIFPLLEYLEPLLQSYTRRTLIEPRVSFTWTQRCLDCLVIMHALPPTRWVGRAATDPTVGRLRESSTRTSAPW